jgi:hypothetical protein
MNRNEKLERLRDEAVEPKFKMKNEPKRKCNRGCTKMNDDELYHLYASLIKLMRAR